MLVRSNGIDTNLMMIVQTPEKEKQCDGANETPLTTCQLDQADVTTLSSITEERRRTPENLKPKMKPSDMGLPPTPPCRTIKMPEMALLEIGYDSDFQMGPFIQDGIENGRFFSWMKLLQNSNNQLLKRLR